MPGSVIGPQQAVLKAYDTRVAPGSTVALRPRSTTSSARVRLPPMARAVASKGDADDEARAAELARQVTAGMCARSAARTRMTSSVDSAEPRARCPAVGRRPSESGKDLHSVHCRGPRLALAALPPTAPAAECANASDALGGNRSGRAGAGRIGSNRGLRGALAALVSTSRAAAAAEGSDGSDPCGVRVSCGGLGGGEGVAGKPPLYQRQDVRH